MPPTLEEIRRRGLEALRRELGRAGLARFLQHFSTGEGDYSRERHAWVERTSLEELVATAKALRGRKRAKRTN